MRAGEAIFRRALGDSRVRNGAFAALFAFVAVIQVVGYRHSYPTTQDRLDFAHSFGGNQAARLFYGVPHDLTSVGGYASWRVAGILSVLAAVWGVLAAIRALRAEEDAGRQELVLAGTVSRRRAFSAVLGAVGAGAGLLWVALLGGLVVAGLPLGPSAYLSLATVSAALVFAGVGALASQLAPTRRLALELSGAALLIALLLRVIPDTSTSLQWVRWMTPLGWVEELRPFVHPQPAVLILPVLGGAALLAVAARISLRRDVGTGVLAARDRSAPRLGLLGSPTAQALRAERLSLLGWVVGVGFFAVVVGTLSTTFTTANVAPRLREQLQHVGGATVTTPSGALGLYFLFFVLVISLFAASQVAAARHEEAGGHLETLLALPVGRIGWLAGRLALAVGASAGLALAAGALAWAGAAAQGAGVSLPDMLGAGANCLPAALLFLAVGALTFAAAPRATVGVAYGVVAVAFLWELFGGLLGAPAWALALSPFHHVGLVPAQPFKAGAAAVMLALAIGVTTVALGLMRRRDLAGA